MRVVVYAQDLSGRRDDGYYTKPDITSALDLFFAGGTAKHYFDQEGNHEVSREDAEAIFKTDGRVTFYNEDTEKIVLVTDVSP